MDATKNLSKSSPSSPSPFPITTQYLEHGAKAIRAQKSGLPYGAGFFPNRIYICLLAGSFQPSGHRPESAVGVVEYYIHLFIGTLRLLFLYYKDHRACCKNPFFWATPLNSTTKNVQHTHRVITPLFRKSQLTPHNYCRTLAKLGLNGKLGLQNLLNTLINFWFKYMCTAQWLIGGQLGIIKFQ